MNAAAFTDDDLKRLKEESESDFPRMGTPPYLKALLARLEAAEEILDTFRPYGKREIGLVKAWRKAAGK